MNFLHTFQPESILFQIGPFTVYYYGLFIVLGIIAAASVALWLAKKINFPTDKLLDSAFWAIIFGLLGARLYHVGLELPYYLEHPLEIFFIWQGGIAIHGGLIGGGLAIYFYARKHKLDIYKLLSLYALALPLAQAIGRWGNYFNQEVYGYPTDLPWGIPIEAARRLPGFINSEYFHPTFLYESIGNLIIFILLLTIFLLPLRRGRQGGGKAKPNDPTPSLPLAGEGVTGQSSGSVKPLLRNPSPCQGGGQEGVSMAIPSHPTPSLPLAGEGARSQNFYKLIISVYLISYSLLRFIMEYFRIDPTPEALGLRFPQTVSLLIIVLVLAWWLKLKFLNHKL